MSVLIKGINIKEIKFGAVAIMNIDDVAYFVRSDDIVAIPDHGDLIDRDALMARKGSAYDIDGHELYAVGTGTILRMPAVIPAEKSNDDWEEPEINPCHGCGDYDGRGGCKSHGGCGAERSEE